MKRIAIIAIVLLMLAGCAGLAQVKPQLESTVAGKTVSVKATVSTVYAVAYSPDGRHLISGGDNFARIWDVTAARSVKTFNLQTGGARLVGAAYSPDGQFIAISSFTGLSSDAVTRVWEAKTGELARTVPGDFGIGVFFSRDSRYLFGNAFHFKLVGGVYFTAQQFDLSTNRFVRSFPHYLARCESPDGRKLLLVGDSDIRLVELESGRNLWQIPNPTGEANRIAAFTPDGRYILISHNEFSGLLGSSAAISVMLYDATTGAQVRELAHYQVQGTTTAMDKARQQLGAIIVSPDGRFFITGSNGGEYRLWDMASGQLIRALKRPNEKTSFDMSYPSASFSPNGKLVAIASAASVRFYDVATGSEAAAMIAFDDDEWLATTPSGYYNASEKGDEYLDVTIGGRSLSISQLRESFYRPDLVKVAMAGGTLENFRQVTDLKPPPSVAITDVPMTTHEPTIEVPVRVVDQGGGIGDVRVYRNGSAVVSEKARSLTVMAKEGDALVLRFNIPLEPGRNAIRAIAFNADNTVQSQDALAEVTAEISSHAPGLYAVVVGIQEFLNPRLALAYPTADAQLFADTLEQGGKGLFGAIHVKRLVAPSETTNTAIVKALETASREVGPEDLFVFYVASHGTVDDGRYLLITSNVGSTSSSHLKQDALSQDTLKNLISNIPASKKFVVLDTCNAGQMGDAIQMAMLTRGMSEDTAVKVLSRAVGSTVLSASTSAQEALEGYKGHGLFTYVVAAGLSGKADQDGDGFVKTLELADYVDSQVPMLAETVFKRRQYPIVSPTGQGFPLARVSH